MTLSDSNIVFSSVNGIHSLCNMILTLIHYINHIYEHKPLFRLKPTTRYVSVTA